MTTRNHEIRVGVSKEELEKIRKKAETASMNNSSFLRYLGLNCKVKVTIEEWFTKYYLKYISLNLLSIDWVGGTLQKLGGN